MRGRKKERQRYLCGTKKRGRAIVADEKKTKLSWRLKKERQRYLCGTKKRGRAIVADEKKDKAILAVEKRKT